MGGIDKASIEIDGVTLLERTLAATLSVVEVPMVGDGGRDVDTWDDLRFVRESTQ